MKIFRFYLLLVLLLTLCTASSCRKKPPVPQEDSEEAAPAETPQKISLSRPEENKENPEPAEKGKDETESENFPAFSGPLFLQQILPQSRILPDGDYCGPLLDFNSTDSAEREAGLLVQNFFNSYRQGILDERFLSADRNPLFSEELDSFKQPVQEMTDYIVGSFSPSASDASLRIRLYSVEGSITGVLYLSHKGDKWFLEDWELPRDDWP